ARHRALRRRAARGPGVRRRWADPPGVRDAGAGGAHPLAAADEEGFMNRFDLTKRLVAKLQHREAVIGGIGNTNFDLWAAGQRPENFYMLGSMGLAVPIALGVALAQPARRIFALEGDGS